MSIQTGQQETGLVAITITLKRVTRWLTAVCYMSLTGTPIQFRAAITPGQALEAAGERPVHHRALAVPQVRVRRPAALAHHPAQVLQVAPVVQVAFALICVNGIRMTHVPCVKSGIAVGVGKIT